MTLDFKYRTDIDGDNNRGWRVDRIDAYLDGEAVGYLKIGYIPQERFVAYYPGILNYLAQMEGKPVLPYQYCRVPYQNIDPQILRKNACTAAIALSGWCSHGEQTRLSGVDDAQILQEYEKFEQMAQSQRGLSFRYFQEWHVDRPQVEYIRVGQKRKGIGTALYRAGYLWMAQRGLTLWASSIQTPEAKAVWEKMTRKYPIKKIRHKRVNQPPIYRLYFAG